MKLGPLALRIIVRHITRADAKRMKTFPDPAPYRPICDINVFGDSEFYHCADVFHAKEEVRKNKTIVYVHGGAYLFGSRKAGFGFVVVLLEHGYDVVCLDYLRNVGKRSCYEQLSTLAAEIRYLETHAKELDINAKDMALVGDSAGGHFALLLAELSDDLSLQKESGLSLGEAKFHGVAASCPVYDVVRATRTPLMNKRAQKFMFGPKFNDPMHYSLISPRAHVASLKMPLFVSSCTNDFLRQESFDLRDDFANLGRKMEFVYIESDRKAVSHVHNITMPEMPESIQVNDAMLSFFDKALS